MVCTTTGDTTFARRNGRLTRLTKNPSSQKTTLYNIHSRLKALISTFELLQHREELLTHLLQIRIRQGSYQGIILEFQQKLRLETQRKDIIRIIEALTPHAHQPEFRTACCQLESIKARNEYQISRGSSL